MVDKAMADLAKGVKSQVGEIVWDDDDVLQEIINIGGQKLVEEKITVTGNLLINAIKEKGARKHGGSVSDLLNALNKARYGDQIGEGEVVEEPLVLEEPVHGKSKTEGQKETA